MTELTTGGATPTSQPAAPATEYTFYVERRVSSTIMVTASDLARALFIADDEMPGETDDVDLASDWEILWATDEHGKKTPIRRAADGTHIVGDSTNTAPAHQLATHELAVTISYRGRKYDNRVVVSPAAHDLAVDRRQFLVDIIDRIGAPVVDRLLNDHAPPQPCRCIVECPADAACSRAGTWHVHPEGFISRCPVHPDAPGLPQ